MAFLVGVLAVRSAANGDKDEGDLQGTEDNLSNVR
jgi:hypothetical protein